MSVSAPALPAPRVTGKGARPVSASSADGVPVAPVPETNPEAAPEAEMSPRQISNMLARNAATFGCMQTNPVSYVYSCRTTHSDVMSVTTTSSVFSGADRRHVAMLSTSRRLHLPAPKSRPVQFAFASAKKSRALIRERDEFMARLRREREERHIQENLAAVRIQSVWRGHTVRPRPQSRRKPRKKAPGLSSDEWREELRSLTFATEEHIHGGPKKDDRPEWRKQIHSRATAKRSKRVKQAAEYYAATDIVKVVKGFLCRRAFSSLVAVRQEEAANGSTVRIQAMIRGWALRCSLSAEIQAKRERAATQIQSLARGIFARDRCRWLMRRMRAAQEQHEAAIAIQSAYRTQVAKRKVRDRKQTVAALAMQKSFRGHSTRRSLAIDKRKKALAATRIQAAGRGYITRRRLKPRLANARKARRRSDEERAAVRIQKISRGRRARKQVAAKRRNRDKTNRAKEERSAVHVQRLARGKQARAKVKGMKQAKQEEKAALRIQSRARGAAGRKRAKAKAKELEKAREEEAARHVQRIARGRNARKKVRKIKQSKEEKEAAVRIQAIARRRAAKKRVDEIRKPRREALEEQASEGPRRRKRKKRGSGQSDSSAGNAPAAPAPAPAGSGGGRQPGHPPLPA